VNDISTAEAVAAVRRVAARYDPSFAEGEMTVSIHSPFRSKPRISRAGFVTVLQRTGSLGSAALWGPTPQHDRASVAGNVYDAIVNEGGDPAVYLAICGREHTFGQNQSSVLWRSHNAGQPTRAWGNQRTIRHPGIEHLPQWNDPERRSAYARFASVIDSARDAVYRVNDPSFAYSNAQTILEVISIWAPSSDDNKPQGFAQYIADRINEWQQEFPPEEPMTAQIPGFKWLPAKGSHFSRGRTQKIRGYAQHYTAGTDSRAWLTWQSSPPVSSTFLIKHNPTLEDRGWQLVRIEDTAWTTANANPYTVSCEYEHTGHGTISEDAYTVMAQTIIDTAAYVKHHDLGKIRLDRQHIRGHKEWVGNPDLICPNGVIMDRLVKRVQELNNELIVNGIKLYGAMRMLYETLGNRAIAVLGLPLTEEFEATVDGVERRVMIWERAVTGWYPEDKPHGVPPSHPMHVRCLTIDEAIDVYGYALGRGLI
jgi:hypothetical protein